MTELLREQDVSVFVKNSPYLQALLSIEPFPESGIEVPRGCAKQNKHVTNAEEFREMLQTLRFWMVPDVLESCKELLSFAFDPVNEEVLKECAAEYELTLPSLLQIQTIVCTTKCKTERLDAAIANGWVYLLELMCEELQYPKPLGAEHLRTAARSGKLQSLRYLHEIGGTWDASTLFAAVGSGCLECVKYVVGEGCPGLT